MAAGVQHDDAARGHGRERRLHAGEIDAAGGGVVVAVGAHGKARRLEDAAVVFPAGVGDVDGGFGHDAPQQIAADAQRPGAAQPLGGDDAPFGEQRGIGTEEQALDGAGVGRRAFDGLVAARLGLTHARLLGGLHRGEQRDAPFFVVIHAHAEVHFLRAWVGGEGFVESEDGVARREFDRGEEAARHGSGLLGLDHRAVPCGNPLRGKMSQGYRRKMEL